MICNGLSLSLSPPLSFSPFVLCFSIPKWNFAPSLLVFELRIGISRRRRRWDFNNTSAMENTKGTASGLSYSCSGKQTLLPPKGPGFSTCLDSTGFPALSVGHGLRHHQRTSSEGFLMEEQPFWLDDLLNEPELPVKRGTHRRSSSDSFTYMDVPNVSYNLDVTASLEYKHKNTMQLPSWGNQEFDHCRDAQYPFNHSRKQQSRGWGTPSKGGAYTSNVPSRGQSLNRTSGSSGYTSEPDGASSSGTKKQNEEAVAHESLKDSSEKSEGTNLKQSQPDIDQKRMKQQFAQRSRVRKLQYIADLERNVQVLQAEGSEVSAELQFIDQQNIILSMENETLRQRVESLAQEHLIKQYQQEMLEREISRLRSLIMQQQQPAFSHGRSNSRDLDAKFTNLSLKQKETSSKEVVNVPLHM